MSHTPHTPVPNRIHNNHHIALPLPHAPKTLPPPHEPIRRNNNDNHRIHKRHIIHVARQHRFGVRKAVHDEREERPAEGNNVGEEADATEPEGTVFDGRSTPDEEADYGDGVAEVEEDDAGCDHAVGVLVVECVWWETG